MTTDDSCRCSGGTGRSGSATRSSQRVAGMGAWLAARRGRVDRGAAAADTASPRSATRMPRTGNDWPNRRADRVRRRGGIAQLGVRKPDAASYRGVLARLDVPAEAVLFFDDSAANVTLPRPWVCRPCRSTGRPLYVVSSSRLAGLSPAYGLWLARLRTQAYMSTLPASASSCRPASPACRVFSSRRLLCPSTAAQSLMVCGWDEVFVLDVSSAPRKVWSWKASDRPELPPAYRTKFRTTDECKPVDGRSRPHHRVERWRRTGRRSTGRTIWWGACGNTHSAELLPGDRIVLACSTREGTGNSCRSSMPRSQNASSSRRSFLGSWRRVGRDTSAAVGARREGTPLVSAGGVGDDRVRARAGSLATHCPISAGTNSAPYPVGAPHSQYPRRRVALRSRHSPVRARPGSRRHARRQERRHRSCHRPPRIHAGRAARVVDEPHPFPPPGW